MNTRRSVDSLDTIHKVAYLHSLIISGEPHITYICDAAPDGMFEANLINYLGRPIYIRAEPQRCINELIPLIPSTDRDNKTHWARPLCGYNIISGDGIVRANSNIDGTTLSLPDYKYNGDYINLIPYQEFAALYKAIDTEKNPVSMLDCVASPILNCEDVICGFLYKKREYEKQPF